jgi:hypothetical protein
MVSACCARSASHTFHFGLFQFSRTFLSAAGVSTRYSSRPPFRERRVSAALAKFLECRLLGLCRGISTFDEIRLLKAIHYLDLLHPWVGKLTSFPINACANRQLSLPEEYKCQRYAKRGYSADTIGYVNTNTAGNAATTTRSAVIEPTTAATTSAISTQ